MSAGGGLDPVDVAAVDVGELRHRVRGFYDDELPRALDGVTGEVARAKAWRRGFYDTGLAGIGFPVDVGGHGGTVAHLRVLSEESRGRMPGEESLFGIGVGMALPTLRDHASTALQRRFLRPGLRGDELWCQLYSEPDAGSDLASLATSAELDGDEWVVSGQKVWTSGAHHSDYGILLVRTDRDAPKHRGITMLVLPMRQRGVSVRPLRQMTGVAEFNEVFLDEARAPADFVVGEVDEGWRMAVALLAHERRATGVASIGRVTVDRESRSKTGRLPLPFTQLLELARDRKRSVDPLVRQELARAHSGERVMTWLGERGVHPSIGKLWRTRQGRLAAQIALELAFPGGLAWAEGDEEASYWSYHILNCRAMSIGGGTDEVQRTTLGEQALGLAREPAVDRDVPFRNLLRTTTTERRSP